MNFTHEDKLQHFIVGIMMSISFHLIFFVYLAVPYWWAVVLNVSCGICIAIGFELFSLWTGKGHYEIMDAVVTIVGIPIGILLTSMIKYSI